MRYGPEHKTRTRDRIVRNAARKLRAEGLSGSGVASVMKASGLTVGGFYKHFGSKDDMKYLAEQRAKQLRDHYNFPKAGVYDPPGVGGTGVIYVLHDASQPELYGGLPKDPRIPLSVKLWKGPLKWLGNIAMVGGLIGLFAHYLRYGPKEREEEAEEPHEGAQP